MLLHHGDGEEQVWNSGDPLGHDLVSSSICRWATIATTPDKNLVNRGPDPSGIKLYVTSASRPPRAAEVLVESEGNLERVGEEGDGEHQSS